MKYVSKILMLTVVVTTLFTACKKDENQLLFQGGTNPVLTANRANNSTINMSYVNRSEEAVKFMWTNPDFKFNTGLSSQNVNYTIEMDTTGKNFKSPKLSTFSVSQDLSRSLSQEEINNIIVNIWKLDTGVTYKVDFRVKAKLVSNSTITELFSNSFTLNIKSFGTPPKVNPPVSGELWITGDATGAWMCGCPMDLTSPRIVSQKFTRVSNTLFVLNSINLVGDGEYLFVPRYGNWSEVPPDPEKFGAVAATNSVNPLGDEFRFKGNNYKAPSVSGLYKIEVDFQRGRFTLTKL